MSLTLKQQCEVPEPKMAPNTDAMRILFDSPILKGDLSGKLIQFINCRSLHDDKITRDDVWVENGRIIDGSVIFYDRRQSADLQVDCEGHILSPGFIDIQN